MTMADLRSVAGSLDAYLTLEAFLEVTSGLVLARNESERAEGLTAIFNAFVAVGTAVVEFPELLIVGVSDLAPPDIDRCTFVVRSFAANDALGLDRPELAEVVHSILLCRRALSASGGMLSDGEINTMSLDCARTAMPERSFMKPRGLRALLKGPNLRRALDSALQSQRTKPWVNRARVLFAVKPGDVAEVVNALAAASNDDGRVDFSAFSSTFSTTLRWSSGDGTATTARDREETLRQIFVRFDRSERGVADTDEIAAGVARLALPGIGAAATINAILSLYGEQANKGMDLSELSDFLQATRTFEESLLPADERESEDKVEDEAEEEGIRIMRIIDTDGDGVMTHEEFRIWFAAQIVPLPSLPVRPRSSSGGGDGGAMSAPPGRLPKEKKKRRPTLVQNAWKDRLNHAIHSVPIAPSPKGEQPKDMGRRRESLQQFDDAFKLLDTAAGTAGDLDSGALATLAEEGGPVFTPPGASEVEQRVATDGNSYTKKEFIAHYGGLVEWTAAGGLVGAPPAAPVLVATAAATSGDWVATTTDEGTYWYHTHTMECVIVPLLSSLFVTCPPPYLLTRTPLSSAPSLMRSALTTRTTWDEPTRDGVAALDTTLATGGAAMSGEWVATTTAEGTYWYHTVTREYVPPPPSLSLHLTNLTRRRSPSPPFRRTTWDNPN